MGLGDKEGWGVKNTPKSCSQPPFFGSALRNSSVSLPMSQPDLKFFIIGASWELAYSDFKTVISTFLGIKKQAIQIILLDAKFEKAHNTLIFQDNECLKVDPRSCSTTEKELCPLASQEALFS